MMIRIAFLIATLALGLKVAAHATTNEYQEQQADRFCEVNPNYCNSNWALESVPVV